MKGKGIIHCKLLASESMSNYDFLINYLLNNYENKKVI